jgi:hypothetical protein
MMLAAALGASALAEEHVRNLSASEAVQAIYLFENLQIRCLAVGRTMFLSARS